MALTFEWNWDGKLRSAVIGTKTVEFKYDPMGNRVYKKTTEGENFTEWKYLVDIAGGLSTIIGEIEADSSSPDYGSLKKSYFYADAQILSQRVHTDPTDPNVFTPYFYVHDRLGSVRLVVGYDGTTAEAVNSYTYTPFGQVYDGQCIETVDNPWQFTGQWHDGEFDQYYLRARMYDPTMMRFTSRDPVFGKLGEPPSLHKYLYCRNDTINRIDIDGRWAIVIGGSVSGSLNDGIGLVSSVTKSKGIAAGSLVRQGLIGQLANELFGGNVYGSAGIATVIGMNNEDGKAFIGSMYSLSGGVSTNAGVSVMAVYGFSPNANKLSDFAGSYMEAGISQTEGGLGGGVGGTGSFGISRGYGSDVMLFTLSFGGGASSGKTSTSIFGGYGYSWVADW